MANRPRPPRLVVSYWVMTLTTLKPRLSAASLGRVAVLTTKAGTTERERGRSWQRKRESVLLGSDCMCALCKTAAATEVDHIVPLEQGGSNDELNLQALCRKCHLEKSREEARVRFGK